MYSRRQFLNRLMITTGGAFIVLRTDAFARATEALGKLNPLVSPAESASDEDFWGRIQSAFDVDRSLINLNNGGVSPSPRVSYFDEIKKK